MLKKNTTLSKSDLSMVSPPPFTKLTYKLSIGQINVGNLSRTGTDTEPHDHAVVRALQSHYAPNKAVRGEPARTLFVGRLNPRTTQASSLAVFLFRTFNSQ